jgi:adenylylsulfate kinase-like enzyme
MIIWFTGQPGSGKTTLAYHLIAALLRADETVFHLDGDHLRQMSRNFDYSEDGRRRNVHTAGVIAQALDSEDVVIICSLVSPYREQREMLKRRCDVLEVYTHGHVTSHKSKFCLKNYEPPLSNFVDVDTRTSEEECITKVLAAVVNKMAATSALIAARY